MDKLTLLVPDPTRYITHLKKSKTRPPEMVKVYLTLNGVYSCPNHRVRTKLFNMGKMHLMAAGIHLLPKLPLPLKMHLLFSDTTTSDLDNVSWFWFKCMGDTLNTLGKVPEDETRYIQNLEAQFKPGPRNLLFTFSKAE